MLLLLLLLWGGGGGVCGEYPGDTLPVGSASSTWPGVICRKMVPMQEQKRCIRLYYYAINNMYIWGLPPWLCVTHSHNINTA